METKPSTSKLPTTAASAPPTADDLLLNLPDGRGFTPVKWDVPLEVITQLSEARLPLVNGRPGAQAERLARMAPARFRL